MIITQILEKSKTKAVLFADGEEWCTLPVKTVRSYGLSEGSELPEAVCASVEKELYKLALAKCGELLGGSDYTEYSMRQKLETGGYPTAIIDRVLQELKDAHYLDDRRYTESYIRSRSQRQSFLKIRMDLRQKGIPGALIDEVLEEMDSEMDPADEEEQQIRAFFRKKNFDPETADPETRMKMLASLYRKGYRRDAISRVMEES